MKVSKDNPNIEISYTSLTGKINVYGLKDITRISAFRGVAAEKAKRFAGLNMTETELKKLIDHAINGINQRQPDIAKAVAILHEINLRLQMICEENSLLELAYIYCMLEGEDDEEPTQEWNKKKAELAQAHPDIRAFFLRTALELAGNFSAKPGVDLLSYLEEIKGLVESRMRMFTD